MYRCARLKFVLQRRDSISANSSLTFAPEFEPIDPVDKVEFTTMQVHRDADDRWRWGTGTIAPDAAHEVHMFDSIPPGRYRLSAELRAISKNPGVLTRYAPIEQVVDLSVGENSISIDLTPVEVLVKCGGRWCWLLDHAIGPRSRFSCHRPPTARAIAF